MNKLSTPKPPSKIVDITFNQPEPQRREVEAYVGFPIGEELRARLELFVNEHVEHGEEDLFAMLLDLGLRMANEGAELDRSVAGVVDADDDDEPELRAARFAARRRLLSAAARRRSA